MKNTPSQQRSREKIEAVFKATERLLGEYPIDDISTSMIAREANITRTSLYHFFPSKLDVFEALMQHYQEDLKARVIGYFDVGKRNDYRSAWTGVASVYRDYFNTNPIAAKLLLGDANSKQILLSDDNAGIAEHISNFMETKTDLSETGNGTYPGAFVFQIMTRLMTSIFSVGMRRDGKITKAIDEESNLATIAYLDSSIKNHP